MAPQRRNADKIAPCLSFAAKNATERTAAVDALVDLARRGLLDGTELGMQAAALMKQDLVVGQRVAQGLVDVARADTVATAAVLDALTALMPVLPGRRDAWPSPVTGTSRTEGELTDSGLAITIESEHLVLFGDGIESDNIGLTSGQRVIIRRAQSVLQLVR